MVADGVVSPFLVNFSELLPTINKVCLAKKEKKSKFASFVSGLIKYSA